MKEVQEAYSQIVKGIESVILGQKEGIRLAVAAVLTGGHCLLEGLPGTGKTLLVRTVASLMACEFRRIQFTPDLMPTDIIGNMIYNMKEGEFSFRKGPIFSQFILADEINRAPAKTQSALLEAMQEKQVTVDGKRHDLGPPFIVFATQNPIEQEGTYPLPEAQLDRFLFKILIPYPIAAEEKEMLKKLQKIGTGLDVTAVLPKPLFDAKQIAQWQKEVQAVSVREELFNYLHTLILRTRSHSAFVYGASPRAGLMMLAGAKALAAFEGRDYCIPDDIKEVFVPALRHRVILQPTVEVEQNTPDHLLTEILNGVEVPK